MAAAITDLITQATVSSRPTPSQASATRAPAGATLSTTALTGWPTGTAVFGCTYKVTTAGVKIAGSQIDFKAVVSGTQLVNFTVRAGTDVGNAIGDIVECAPIAAYANDLYQWGIAQHNQDGSHGAITTTSITNAGAYNQTSGAFTLPNNSITANELSTSAITLGYAETSATYNTSSTSIVDVTGLTTTVTVPAGGRRCRITVYVPTVSNGGASNNAYNLYIRESTTTLQTARGNIDIGKAEGSVVLIYSAVLSAGSHTYKASIAMDASVSTDLVQSATSKAFILVEAI